jgi:predicted metal-dependent hydrolase
MDVGAPTSNGDGSFKGEGFGTRISYESTLEFEPMRETVRFEEYHVEIYRRARQRTLNLRVKSEGRLSVSCARGVSKREIFGFISEQRDFIHRCLKDLAEHRRRFPLKKFESGEKFLFEGVRLELQIVWGWNERIRVSRNPHVLEMVAPLTSTREDRKKALFNYYKKMAKPVLLEGVRDLAERMDLYPRSVSIRGQTTRWGSCTSRGDLNLNWKLIAVPFHVLEYVLIHELAHLRHMNHSEKFWALVEKHCPDFKSAKRWLREYEPELNSQFQKNTNPL